jgi:hypothetical protein
MKMHESLAMFMLVKSKLKWQWHYISIDLISKLDAMKEVSEEEILQVEDAWQQPVLQLQWIKKIGFLDTNQQLCGHFSNLMFFYILWILQSLNKWDVLSIVTSIKKRLDKITFTFTRALSQITKIMEQ